MGEKKKIPLKKHDRLPSQHQNITPFIQFQNFPRVKINNFHVMFSMIPSHCSQFGL